MRCKPFMTGQQVNMPQMPSFNAAGAANPTQYLGAAQAQGDYEMQAWQQQQKMWGDIFGGAGGGVVSDPFHVLVR
jgi:hypothetical protein